MDELSSPFREKMQAGHDARQNDSGPAGQAHAVELYQEALSLVANTGEKAEAHEAMAVSYRVIGDFDKAEDSFDEARSHAEDPLMVARIERDLGALWHERAVKYLDQHRTIDADEAFDEAGWLFDRSMRTFYDAGEAAEHLTSLGFLGMMLFEQGLRVKGYTLLREADDILSGLANPHPVYEANTLIRRMRVSPLLGRLRLLPRALRLTRKGGESSGSRKRVFVALLGNRVYRRVMKQQQGK